MNASQTREKCTTGLKRFFDFIDISSGNNTTNTPIEELCKYFCRKGKK
ncbi:MAG TPA: hypothetical protein VE818_07070 [Nitrososphaeraceae archaeon]|nr:hypothetical protein [Nitrososphaeraceae archaeon]